MWNFFVLFNRFNEAAYVMLMCFLLSLQGWLGTFLLWTMQFSNSVFHLQGDSAEHTKRVRAKEVMLNDLRK